MKISVRQLRLSNFVFYCIFLITLAQYSLAGLEVLFDGKKFFYRSNEKDVPIELSLGSEIARFQELNYPNNRKTRETEQNLKPDMMEIEVVEHPEARYSCEGSRNSLLSDLGTEIVENQLGGMVEEDEEQDQATRYDLMASLANQIETENPEDRINDIISLIKEDLERHFRNEQGLHE